MTDQNQCASIEAELLPCPLCGGTAHLTKGYATENVWSHGEFHRVFCGACQIRQLFHRTAAEAIAAWNRRTPAAAAGAGDLPKQGDAHALAVAAKFDVLYDKDNGVHHYHGFIENLEGLIERAIAADRAQQKAAFDAAVSLAGDTIDARNTEIADLRAQLAQQGQDDALDRELLALAKNCDERLASLAAPASAQPADNIAQSFDDKVLELLSHIEDVTDEANWEKIDVALWNAVTSSIAMRQRAAPQPAARAAVQDESVSELKAALKQRNDSAHREREKLMAHIINLETALWKMGEPGEAALKQIRAASPATVTAPAAPATKGTAGQDQRALELAHGALIAAQPRDAQPAGWERHEKAINAVAAALHKPSAAGMVGQDAKDAAEMLDLLKDAARAWNNESDSELDATMERVECFLLDHRATLAAQQAQASAKDEGGSHG